MPTSLPAVLRIVAGLLLLVATVQVLVNDQFLAPPYILGAVLGLLSLVPEKWLRPTAFVCLVLAVLVPLGAIIGFVNGAVPVLVVIFDVLVFGWLGWTALSVVRGAPEGA